MKTFPAIKILHPIGEFYLTALPASLLLNVGFTTPLTLNDDKSLSGNQRRRDSKRISEISKYLQTQDAALPGTIILAANCTEDGKIISPNGENESTRWSIVSEAECDADVVKLKIPTDKKLAAVVDGQHRLWGFEELSDDLKETFLPCAVFFDLPSPQQASIFATINFNQKPVSKSQTYELFGYNLDEEPESAWSPEKLAVFFARKLNMDELSPLRDHIKVAAQDDRVLDEISKKRQKEWAVSTATIVEGIISLISKDPKNDRDTLHSHSIEHRSRKHNLEQGKTPPPFRELYRSEFHDIVIYKTLINYFNAVNEIFWKNISSDSKTLIRKTAGVQALFRVLKELLPEQIKSSDLRESTWKELLNNAEKLDFGNINVFESSGRGRKRIQDAILVAIGRQSIDEIKDVDFKTYLESIIS